MQTNASLKTVRQSARKMRLVADMVRGKKALDAITTLQFVRRDAAPVLRKLIASAVANAEHAHKAEPSSLWISQIMVDNAGFIKRFRPRAMGRAAEIHKHLSHVKLTLCDEARVAKKK